MVHISEGRLCPFASAGLTLGWVCLGTMTTALVPGIWAQQGQPGHALLKATAEAQDNGQKHKSGLGMGTRLLPSLPGTKARHGQAQAAAPGRYRPGVISCGHRLRG